MAGNEFGILYAAAYSSVDDARADFGGIEELGDTLDEGQAGIVLLAVLTPDEGFDRYVKRAAKVMKKQVDADAEQLKKAIDEAVTS
jgi:uncharacterized membrane protein